MQLYTNYNTKISYSPLHKVATKTAMKYIRDRIIYTHDEPWQRKTEIIKVDYDRQIDVGMTFNAYQLMHALSVKISTITNLNYMANHIPFYSLERRSLKNGSYLTPITFTEIFLCRHINPFMHGVPSLRIYRKRIKVKLGFCGSHLKIPNRRSHSNKWWYI